MDSHLSPRRDLDASPFSSRLVGRGSVLAALGMLLQACSPDPKSLPADAVVRVGARIVTAAELSREIHRRGISAGDTGQVDARRREVLDALIDEEAIVQRAIATGLDRDPEIQRRYRRMLANELRQRTQESSVTKALAEDDLRRWYSAYAHQFVEPSEARGRLISIRLPRDAAPEVREAARARLEDARARIAAADDSAAAFADRVRALSDDPSTRRLDGDTGWLHPKGLTRWPDSVVTTLFELATPGTLSSVLSTPEALYLIRLTERKPERIKPFDQVRARIEHEIVAERTEQAEKKFVAEARRAVEIRENPAAFASVPVPIAASQLVATPPPIPGTVPTASPSNP